MNVLKSVLKISKNEANSSQVSQLYEQVKSWDQARARLLQNYLKVVELALEALDGKVGQVENYIQGLDKLMTARIEQITSYCKNGINDSEFFLVPSSLESLKPCHQLLKHLLMEESQREQNLANKGSVLTVILEKLKKLRDSDGSQEQDYCQEEETTIRELKSNIRYLIDCQLPDLNEEVMGSCRAVSHSFEQNKNIYLSVANFTAIADKQVQKHKEIGKELLSLVRTFSQRQKDIRIRLRQILIEWVNEDMEDKIFGQQLAKNPAEELINDYYNIQNLIADHSDLWRGQSLQKYLQNFEILPFREHERLVVYARQVFYNGKIEAKVVLTHKQAYLFRVGHTESDFTYILSKNIRIKQKEPLTLQLAQVRKTMLLREEKQFKFTLEFNLETDMRQFKSKSEELGCLFEK